MGGKGRKHVAAGVVAGCPEPRPDEGQHVARVLGCRGANLLQVRCAGSAQPTLALMPAKFRRLLYVKTGGYVIVEQSVEAVEDDAKVTSSIVAVLYLDNIRQLKHRGLWPSEFEEEEAQEAEEVARRRASSCAQVQSAEIASDLSQRPQDSNCLGLSRSQVETLLHTRDADNGFHDSTEAEVAVHDDSDDGEAGLPPLEANTNRRAHVLHSSHTDGESDSSSGSEDGHTQSESLVSAWSRRH
eukprot:jgi/Chlat1/7390/Chrsp6S07423